MTTEENTRSAELNSQIARMERIAALKSQVSTATSDAQAERARLAMEAEKLKMEQENIRVAAEAKQRKLEADQRKLQAELAQTRTVVAGQKEKLDRVIEIDNLFNEAVDVFDGSDVKRVRRGIVVTVRGLFGSGNTAIGDEQKSKVKAIANLVKKYQRYPVIVEGHTDSRGRTSSNISVSQARAQNVVDLFLAEDVPMQRVKAVGYGQANPISDNKTTQGREKNRRIEVVFLF